MWDSLRGLLELRGEERPDVFSLCGQLVRPGSLFSLCVACKWDYDRRKHTYAVWIIFCRVGGQLARLGALLALLPASGMRWGEQRIHRRPNQHRRSRCCWRSGILDMGLGIRQLKNAHIGPPRIVSLPQRAGAARPGAKAHGQALSLQSFVSAFGLLFCGVGPSTLCAADDGIRSAVGGRQLWSGAVWMWCGAFALKCTLQSFLRNAGAGRPRIIVLAQPSLFG